MMDEKAPLIPRFDASRAVPEAAPRQQRCAAKKTALRVLGATAAAGVLYYSIPEGKSIVVHAIVPWLTRFTQPPHTQLRASYA